MRRGGAHRDEVVVRNASLRAVAVAIVVVVVGGGERRAVTSSLSRGFRLAVDFLYFLGHTERIEVLLKTM